MTNRLMKPLLVGMLMTALVAPAALAGVGTSPSAPGTHWSFKVNENGIWQAVGDHVSFSWSLKPFEIYDLTMDGTLLFDELSFPFDATDYMTEGATFKVMVGKENVFQLNDNPAVHIDAVCSSPRDPGAPPDPCDVEFPEGSTFETYARGHVTQFHIEGAVQDNGVQPCWKVTAQGESSLEGSTIMFMGSLNFRLPPGLTMGESREG